MTRPLRVCICLPQVPFVRGGAENLVDGLKQALERHSIEAELISLPWSGSTRTQIARSAMAWRLLDLDEREAIDLVIATRFPAYLIQHPHKVIWLLHQFRQVYDLKGTPYSDIGTSPDDPAVEETVRHMDNLAFTEAHAIYAIAQNVADRLQRFSGFTSSVLYPPPKLDGSYRSGDFGNYVLGVGRLDELKRFALLVRAMAFAPSGLRCKIAGAGPERGELERLIAELGLENRVELLGFVDDEHLIDLYAGSLCVYFAPYDEDYGYITIEAFKSGKPVVTASDSGGALEFVVHEENGFVLDPKAPRQFGRAFGDLYASPERARHLGEAGSQKVTGITWDHVVATLTG